MQGSQPPPSTIGEALSQMQQKLCETGIKKEEKNEFAGWMFAGIDTLRKNITPIFAEFGILVRPECLNHQMHPTQKGVRHIITVKYDLAHKSDRKDPHTVIVMGEASDNGDKGLNQAFTSSWKNMVNQVFAIPTEKPQDSDADFSDGGQTGKMNPTNINYVKHQEVIQDLRQQQQQVMQQHAPRQQQQQQQPNYQQPHYQQQQQFVPNQGNY